MKYETEERRDDDGALFVIFTFANGKIVELRAADYQSGKGMIEAAIEQAQQ